MKDGLFNADRNATQAPRSCLVWQEILRQNPMEIQNRIAVKTYLIGRTHKKCDSVLVIENHRGFQPVLSLCLFAEFNQTPSIEQGIGIAFESAGVPRQVDEQPVQNLFCISARRLIREIRLAHLREMDALFLSGGDIPELAASSQAAKDDAASIGRAVRTYSMMTILFGDSDAAAEAEAARYREGLDEGALHGMMRAYGFLDAEIGKENAFTAKARSTFMTPHVLGTPDNVIERLSDIFAQTSLDGLMLIFPEYDEDMVLFGKTVLPALRAHDAAEIEAATR